MKEITQEETKKIEKAIGFLVNNFAKSGKNPKPVIFHSLEVAFYLLEQGYKTELVIAAILHDILEDTEVREDDLSKIFGKNITSIIKSVSYSEEIKNWTERYRDVFQRTIERGRGASILKCADIYQNSFYIKLVKNIEFQKRLIKKIGYFLKYSKNVIGDEVTWRDLKKQYEAEKKRTNY